MAYMLYNIETTILVKPKGYGRSFETEAAAKAARTRKKLSADEYAIAEATVFYAKIEKSEVRNNLMTGVPFTVGVNSNYATCTSSETYWST